jgi:hypothetical protein
MMTQVEKACESFRVLLEEQLARIANMRTDKVDFTQKDVVTVGLVDGDGFLISEIHLLGIHILDTCHLLFQKLPEVRARHIYIAHTPPSFV